MTRIECGKPMPRIRVEFWAEYFIRTCRRCGQPDSLGEIAVDSTPKPYKPHPNLSPEANRMIELSIIKGGLNLSKMEIGQTVRIKTRNTSYTVTRIGSDVLDHPFLISGHARFCPEPVRCAIPGSTWGGSMLKAGFVGRDMHMEFYVKGDVDGRIVTSPVAEIEEVG